VTDSLASHPQIALLAGALLAALLVGLVVLVRTLRVRVR
jgi:hypothetical protein